MTQLQQLAAFNCSRPCDNRIDAVFLLEQVRTARASPGLSGRWRPTARATTASSTTGLTTTGAWK